MQTMREYPSEVPEETPRKAIFIRNPVKSRRALKTLDVFGYHSSSVQATLAKACAAVLQEENGVHFGVRAARRNETRTIRLQASHRRRVRSVRLSSSRTPLLIRMV